MDDKTIQIINNDILGMKELLYADIIYSKDFTNCIMSYNKKYNIKMKTYGVIKNNEMFRIYEGNIKNQNIYNISVLLNFLEN